MKKLAMLAGLSLSTGALGATDIGTDNPCGLGVVLGQPTGLSGKCYIGGRRFGWDAVVAYEFQSRNGGLLYVHSTAQWHPSELLTEPWGNLSWYVGVGPYLGYWVVNLPYTFKGSRLVIGARSPIGLSLDFADAPVQVSFEVSVGLSIIPATSAHVGGGLGVRYFF